MLKERGRGRARKKFSGRGAVEERREDKKKSEREKVEIPHGAH